MARVNREFSAAVPSRGASATPVPSTSDQENRDPETRQRQNGKDRASDMASQGSLPTPTSADDRSALRAQKRRQIHEDDTTGTPNGAGGDDEDKFTRYFDPNQDADERRDLKRKSRALEREFNGMLGIVWSSR